MARPVFTAIRSGSETWAEHVVEEARELAAHVSGLRSRPSSEPHNPHRQLRWLVDIFLTFVGGRKMITNEAREFLKHLLEVNTARVQNNVLDRIQESRGGWNRDSQAAAGDQPHRRAGT